MKRLLFHGLLGAAVGGAWGLAGRWVPGPVYTAITAGAALAIGIWAARSLRELRGKERVLEGILDELRKRR